MKMKNTFLSILSVLLFCSISSYFQKTAYADSCSGNLGDNGEDCCYSGTGGNVLPCDGPTCVCNGSLICTDESDINDPLNWKCRGSDACGVENGSCCATNDPTQKCQSGLACFRDPNATRSCKRCGVENGPCCVTGNPCGVGLELDGTVGNENCVCNSIAPPPPPPPGTVTGTCAYTDPVTDEEIPGQCILCNLLGGQWDCPCPNGSLYDPMVPGTVWHCVENGLTPQQQARCCVAAQPSPVCGAQGRDEHCVPVGDCENPVAAPGIGCSSLYVCCSGLATTPPPPPEMVYTGPVIESLEEILGPVTKMLYYGGLAIGVFFIILAGYKLMVSEGDPQRTKAAQEQLTSAIIGIIFILLSVTILRVIINQIIGENI